MLGSQEITASLMEKNCIPSTSSVRIEHTHGEINPYLWEYRKQFNDRMILKKGFNVSLKITINEQQ